MAEEKNEASNALDEVVQSIHQMDDSLLEVSQLEGQSKYKHSIKKWYESMKAIHDIKRALHKVDKYEKFDETELENFTQKNDLATKKDNQ